MMVSFIRILKISALLSLLTFFTNQLFAQSKPSHYRGLSITSDGVAWVSGTKGIILRSQFPSFTTFDTFQTGYLRKDFRDIWALNSKTAVAMSIADSAVVIKTNNGGESWQVVYHNESPGIFLDVIEIDPKTGIGIILGDPMMDNQNSSNKKYFKALFTCDYGSNWLEIPNGVWNTPEDSIESFFAASGSSLKIVRSKINRKKQQYQLDVVFAGSGNGPKLHWAEIALDWGKGQNKWEIEEMDRLNMKMKGGVAWGCYGLCLNSIGEAIAVGGNYSKPEFRGDSSGSIASYSREFFGRWHASHTPPLGYRSGVCVSGDMNSDTLFHYFFKGNPQANYIYQLYTGVQRTNLQPKDFKKFHSIALCTGTNGTDISFDKGRNWLPLQKNVGYNSCDFACNGVYFVGNRGAIKYMELAEMAKMFRAN